VVRLGTGLLVIGVRWFAGEARARWFTGRARQLAGGARWLAWCLWTGR